MSHILNFGVLFVGLTYALGYLLKYKLTNYAVTDTKKVEQAYFNIMWSKKRG